MSRSTIGEFHEESDTWALYVERMENWFEANDVKKEKKVPLLIASMGRGAYEIASALCFPKKPAEKSYEELVKVMNEHLGQRSSKLVERYKFRQYKQQQDSIEEFVLQLKKLARFCNFGDQMDEHLKEQFICGLRIESIRQRLFEIDELSFSEAVKLAISLELAKKNLIHS